MRIGVFIESSPDSVGPFQQSLSTLQALRDELAPDFDVLVFTPHKTSRQRLAELGIEAIWFKHAGVQRLADRLTSNAVGYALIRRLRALGWKRLGRALDALLDQQKIDIALFNNIESDVVLRVGDHPFIVSVWDIDQRDHPDFPDSFRDRTFERVVRNHAVTLQRATAVIVNSRTMADRLHELYRVDRSRLIVAPFRPSWFAREHAAGRGRTDVDAVRDKYRLPGTYLFYPAYLAYHKNALYLLEALSLLQRERGIAIDLVLTGGGPPAVLAVLEKQTRALGLEDRVHLLGYLPDWEIPALYQGAFALVLPSMFGPINLPLYEATLLGCPVLCADWDGCREVMGNSARYCDLMNPVSLADHVAELLADPAARQSMIDLQLPLRERILATSYGDILRPCLNRFGYLRRRWSVDAPGKSR
jgi:glycosyltransferase involved in cell wall biosynthesis